MQDLFTRYISYLSAERNASPYTVRNYKTDILSFFKFLKDKRVNTLHEVDRKVIRAYMSQLTEQGYVKPSIARRLSALRSFYRYLQREEIITINPFATTSSPKLDKRLPEFLTIEEMERLLKAPDLSTPQGMRDRALMELLYASGLRVSELTGLNLEEIDFDTHEVRILGKGSKERVVLMGEPAMKALSIYLKQGRPRLLAKKKVSAVLVNRYGKCLSERFVQKKIQDYANAVGIKKRVHPHMLRHTFATHLLDGGADLRVVQELMGHAQLTSTQIYTHVTKSHARKVYLSAHPMAKEDEKQNK